MKFFFDKIINLLWAIESFLSAGVMGLFLYASEVKTLRNILIILLIINSIIIIFTYSIEYILNFISKYFKISITNVNRKEKK